MARSFDYKGLLYSPEVLGGIGLLTQGLSGARPGVALPSMMQGMKTASMFSAMEKEEEKKRLIEQYADKVPEDQKALFKAFPVIADPIPPLLLDCISIILTRSKHISTKIIKTPISSMVSI